ncbi:hypothetical protein ACP3V5_00415 [Vibrio maritimus]
MKKRLALALLVPALAQAHSQTPREIKKYVAAERADVALDVTNLNTYVQSYEVIVEGKVLGRFTLSPDESKKIQLNLKVEGFDRWTNKIVATRSIPDKGDAVRTEVQSLIRLYRPTIKG